MASNGDIMRLCRLCLVKDEVNIPIFDDHSSVQQIFMKISSCLPVTISKEDKLPKKICDGCSGKLDMLYQFWNTSAKAEKQLLLWLNQAGINFEKTKMDTNSSASEQSINKAVDSSIVKQENEDYVEGKVETSEISTDAKSYILQQQQLPYQKEFSFPEKDPVKSGVSAKSSETEEPPPKRARRAAAMKAPIQSIDSDDEDDEIDDIEPITKTEDESEDSGREEDNDPSFEPASASADDQPGPSGVGKGSADASFVEPFVQVFIEEDPQKLFCCGKTFVSINARRKHDKQHHKPKEFKCEICKKMFACNYQLKIHGQTHITTKTHTCTLCERSFKTDKYLENHMNYNHIRGQFRHQCTVCEKSYRSEKELVQHNESKHEGIVYKCDICFKDFYSDMYLKKHMLQHQEDYVPPSVPCTMCEKIFSCKRSLTVHVESFHNGVRHICEICGKSLSTQYSLRLHMRTHSDEKPFTCEICGKCFAKSSTRQDHLRIHTKQRPHICPECGKGFTQRTPLITHLKSVHGSERPFKCSVCYKAFATKSLLKTHSKVHGTALCDI